MINSSEKLIVKSEKYKFKDFKAITLISLVITIIILIILSGVVINLILGSNGILTKAKYAKDKTEQMNALEKLQLKIVDLQMDILEKENRQTTIEDLKLFTNMESIYYDKEIKKVEVLDNYAIVDIDKYSFKIDEKLKNIEIYERTSSIDATYIVNNEKDGILSVNIKISSNVIIESIILPNGETKKVNKNTIEFTDELISEQEYVYKIKLKDKDIEEYKLYATNTVQNEIIQNESNIYPIITPYGVETNKKIQINFADDNNNYYSIDNGENWKEYDGNIKILQEGNILLKTVKEKEINKIEEYAITYELANDALKLKAYDQDKDTYEVGYGYIYVDEAMFNEDIRIVNCTQAGWHDIKIVFYNKTGEQIYNGALANDNTIKSNDLKILEGTEKIYFYWGGTTESFIYEIGPKSSPEINTIEEYQIFTTKGVESYERINIKYSKASEKRLYKIDNGEWKEYNNEEIVLALGQTLYAKGIFEDLSESAIIKHEATIQTLIGREAYDGDESTYFRGDGIYYMKIDPSMLGKNIHINIASVSGSYCWGTIYFVLEDGSETVVTSVGNYATFNSTVKIPENAVTIKYNTQVNVNLYEIGLAD